MLPVEVIVDGIVIDVKTVNETILINLEPSTVSPLISNILLTIEQPENIKVPVNN